MSLLAYRPIAHAFHFPPCRLPRATITPTIPLGGDDAPALARGGSRRKRPREPLSHLPTRRKITMEPPDDKENQPPPSQPAEDAIERLVAQLPRAAVRYSSPDGQPTQMLHYGESAPSIFMLEKPSERRLRLVVALKEAPRSVAKWLELLRCPLTGDPSPYSRLRLLNRALTCMDADDSAGYTEICIMQAKLSAAEADVRNSFRELRRRRVGEKVPLMYEEEAAFEYQAGNHALAEEILERGVDNDAFSPQQKEEMMKGVAAGRAGWVAAYSGSPQEQKVLALRARSEANRRTHDRVQLEDTTRLPNDGKGVTTPRGLGTTPLRTSFTSIVRTPTSRNREREAPSSAVYRTTTTPSSATPVSHARPGLGFSTVSKTPRTASKSPLLTTPSLPTRSRLKSQSTSRKTHHPPSFRLGGPPLRVIASSTCQSDDDDDDDDDAMMGSQASPMKHTKLMSPIKEASQTTHQSPAVSSEKKAKLKAELGDISHILKWNPDKKKLNQPDDKKIKDSDIPPSKASATAVVPTATVAAMQPIKGTGAKLVTPLKSAGVLESPENTGPAAPPKTASITSTKAYAPDHFRSLKGPHPSDGKADAARGTHAPPHSSTSRTLDHYRSPKRQQLDPSVAAAKNYGDLSSPSSVSSSSSPPVAAMSSAASRDALESLTSRVVVNGHKYIKLEQIGSGGSSKVYRMLGPDLKIYALKKIKLKKLDAQSIAQYTNEIKLLQSLQGNPHIIQLVAAEQDLQQRQINVIMEHGEIDLSERLRSLKGGMDDNLLRVIWTQMLQAVDAIHRKRIIHGDLKPANFLFVNGALKLIDFGIAKAISNDTTNIERDSQIGTVNFMSPEAIQGNTMPNGQRHPEGKMKVGRASDIWSLGCILYQIVYSKPPFADVPSILEKFRCIIDPAVPIPFPPLKNKDLEDVMRLCLQRDHRLRPPITGVGGLLSHSFLRGADSSIIVPPTATVTADTAPQLLSQFGDFLRSQGVATSRVNMFMAIGQEGVRNASGGVPSGHRSGHEGFRNASAGISRTHRYLYNTQERRTDI